MNPLELVKIGLSVGTLIGTLLVWWLQNNLRNTQLEIQLKQEENKAEMLAHQQSVKDDLAEKHDELVGNQHNLQRDFDGKHAENRQALAVHVADDHQQFQGISRTLQRMDGKLDKLNGHT